MGIEPIMLFQRQILSLLRSPARSAHKLYLLEYILNTSFFQFFHILKYTHFKTYNLKKFLTYFKNDKKKLLILFLISFK